MPCRSLPNVRRWSTSAPDWAASCCTPPAGRTVRSSGSRSRRRWSRSRRTTARPIAANWPAAIFASCAPTPRAFTFPRGDLVVYLYNPFGATVLGPLLERLCADRRRDVALIYHTPVERACVDAHPAFELIADLGFGLVYLVRRELACRAAYVRASMRKRRSPALGLPRTCLADHRGLRKQIQPDRAMNSFSTPTPLPIPTATCTPPPGESIQMVFPQNGSITAANLQGVVIAVAP